MGFISMNLEEFFESELSMRKTIWSKRGEKITKRNVDHLELTDITPRTRIELKDKTDV